MEKRAVQGLGNEAGTKKGEEEEGKQEREGRDRRLRGRGRERKEPKVPFSPTLFVDASLEGLHESEAE